jgi:hypothetical protein
MPNLTPDAHLARPNTLCGHISTHSAFFTAGHDLTPPGASLALKRTLATR